VTEKGLAPRDLVGVLALEQGVAERERRPVRIARYMKLGAAVAVADRVLVNGHARIAGEPRLQCADVVRMWIEGIETLDPPCSISTAKLPCSAPMSIIARRSKRPAAC